MFAPSTLTGRLADHAGPAPTALLGLAVLAVAGIVRVLLDATGPAHTAAALLLLGLGWNLGLIGGSAMLASAAPPTPDHTSKPSARSPWAPVPRSAPRSPRQL